MQKPIIISIGVTTAGLVILALGAILGWVVLPIVIDKMVTKEAQLQNGTLIYEKWVDLPLPVYFKAYVWNVTNAHEYDNVEDWSAKPKLKELGPYVYKERRIKYDIRNHPESDTITYRQNITYTFVPEMSVGPDTDIATVLNAPLIAVATILYTVPEDRLPFNLTHKFAMYLLMGPLSRDGFTLKNVNIRDIVFGVRLNAVYDVAIYLLENFLGINFPPELQDGKFGPLVNKNGTNADGLWEVYSGVKDRDKVNMLKTVNGKSEFEGGWKGDCNKISGGDGTFFPPFVKKDRKLFVFTTEICRSVWAEYTKEIEFEGIKGYRFQASSNLFANPAEYPPNDCYCPTPREPLNVTCAPSGVIRLRSCKTGAPVVMSKPHFLHAVDSLKNSVEGMFPNEELHDTFLDLEPTLGAPLSGKRRVQISVETQPLPSMGPVFNTIPRLFFPYMWAEETAELDDALVSELKSKYVTPLKIATAGKWTAVGLGCLGIIAGAISFSYFTWFKS